MRPLIKRVTANARLGAAHMQRTFFRSNYWHSLFVTAALVFAFILGLNPRGDVRASTKREHKNSQDSKPSDISDLKLGVPTERQLAGTEQHNYRFTLTKGQYVRVVALQKGIDVVLALFAPGGEKLSEVDSYGGSDTLFSVAESDGAYRIEVRATDKEAKAGLYELRIEELREATQKDRTAVAAQKLFEEAGQLANQRTAESRRSAITKYEQALPLWIESTYIRGQAATLNEIAILNSNLGEGRKAVEYYPKAVALWRELGDQLNEASTLTNMGTAFWRMGESQKALEAHSQALGLARSVADRQVEALVLSNTGAVYWSLGQPQESLKYYNDALPIFEGRGDRRLQAVTLTNIGSAYQQLGELQKAMDAFRRVISLREALGDRRGQAAPYNNLGLLYLWLGDLDASEKYYLQALEIRRASGDRQLEATNLQGLSILYLRRGDLDAALKSAEQSLTLARAVNDRLLEAYVLVVIGKISERLGDLKKALENFAQALVIRRAIGDRYGESYALSSLGNSYLALDDSVKALEHYNQALKITREIGDKLGETETLYGLARTQSRVGDNQAARKHIEEALTIIESTRKHVTNQDSRSSFFASYQSHYDFLINLLMQMHHTDASAGYDRAALEVSERSRARTLLDSLSETYAQIKEGVDVSLLERERLARHQLSLHSDRLTRLLGGKHTEEQAQTLRKQVEALLQEYRDIEAQNRVKNPKYTALTQPQPLPAKEIQKLLDRDTLLLEYSLSDKKSFMWAVTPDSIKSFELPGRASIEAAAERFNKVITENQNRNIRLQVEAGAALSNLVLGPVVNELSRKRIVIVGDGVLLQVPFSALPIPRANSQRRGAVAAGRNYRPVILEHEVAQLPSASVLAAVRQDRPSRGPAEKTLAVIADPVFQPSDSRVRTNGAAAPNGNVSAKRNEERSAWESGLENLQRLPFSRREADAIAELVPNDQRFKAVDFAANRTAASSDTLSKYRVVHFATHAMLNNSHPELSGIVLSLVDETGQPQNGFVRLYEIYNLRLSADLVVLSACRTALGKQIKGEGLIGLTRGFMYAGSPRVVVSLWEVNDEATAELMKQFYTAMLVRGMHPAAALRTAQVSMLRSRWWNSPYYWAAFELQGEFR
jgi:CHAT domain-containing protein/Tfp pilus assembly protein PilF